MRLCACSSVDRALPSGGKGRRFESYQARHLFSPPLQVMTMKKPKHSTSHSCDILVIGAGPAGLSFARAVAETGLKVTIVEQNSLDSIASPAYDGREIALTHLSRKLMHELNMWDRIKPDQISLIKKAKVVNGNSSYALCFDHTEAGQETLGYMISNHRIRQAAYESLKDVDNVQLITDTHVHSVTTDAFGGNVTFADGTSYQAKLIVAADSRFSATRRMMGISTSMLDFGRTCIVTTMHIENTHEDTAYECFHFDRTLAVLPLNDNQVSVVITLPSEESAKVLNQRPEEFAHDIMQRVDHRYGEMNLSNRLYPYPLVATFAKSFYKNHFVVIGDAAVGMHPVTAHGFNLGLRGACTLATEIKNALELGEDYASASVLSRYSRTHRRVCAPLYHGTNAIVQLYTKDSLPAKIARRVLLRLGNTIRPARKLIMQQLTETNAA